MPRLSSDEISDVVANAVTAVAAAAASIGNSSSMSPSPSAEPEQYPMITSDLALKRRRSPVEPTPTLSSQPSKKNRRNGTAARLVISDGPLRAVPWTRGVAGRSCAACSRRGRKCTPIPNYANAPHHASRLAEGDRELLASRGTDRESAALAAFEAIEVEEEDEGATHVNIRMGVIEEEEEGNAGEEEEEEEEDEYDDDDECEEEREARARLREMAKKTGTWTGHQNGNISVQPVVEATSADEELAKAVYGLAKSAHELSVAAANVAELLRSRSHR
ncbi:hypothetical protein B0T11DRAFT_332156 [Plectosphaerella cucumerina]|uniref:Uncharacterized protein n=1 Tax=Plectosphaerella cucumerina TaxID=40658 RepID=A0A8K0X0B2_9PEZI|nr:hypothetical protein B0T11DRAFT_332156 [Plectosphaerella cucumerina]